MPFLWNPIKEPIQYTTSPSPKQKNSGSIPKQFPDNLYQDFIKKVSALFSRTLNAGMTVEAALVLPLFLFVFVNLVCLLEMMRLQNHLQLALWNTGNKICMYGYLKDTSEEGEEGESSIADEGVEFLFTYGYVKQEMIHYAKETYLDNSPLTGGCSGIRFWESEMFGREDRIDLVATYQVSPWLAIPSVSKFRLSNRYYGHLWTGYQIPAKESYQVRDPVYVTKYGTVYHEKKECSYLKHIVQQVSIQELKDLHNQNGACYELCRLCGEKAETEYYVTNYGSCYHSSRKCPGLSRTIYTIERSRATGYQPCSKCK